MPNVSVWNQWMDNLCRFKLFFFSVLLSRRETLLRCSQCKMTRYCNITCQVSRACVCLCVCVCVYVCQFVEILVSRRKEHGAAIRGSVNVCGASFPEFPLTQSVWPRDSSLPWYVSGVFHWHSWFVSHCWSEVLEHPNFSSSNE